MVFFPQVMATSLCMFPYMYVDMFGSFSSCPISQFLYPCAILTHFIMSFDIKESKSPPTPLTHPYTHVFFPQECFSYSWPLFIHTNIRINSSKKVKILTELLWINKLGELTVLGLWIYEYGIYFHLFRYFIIS